MKKASRRSIKSEINHEIHDNIVNNKADPADPIDTALASTSAVKDEPTEEKPECTICLEQPEERGSLPCGHSFCFDCISAWSKRENSCPLCKERFTSIDKSSLKNKSKTKKRKVRVKAKSQGEDHAIRGHPIFFGLTRHYNQYEDDDIGHFHFNIANLLFFQFTRGLDMDEIEYSPRSRSSHSSDYMNPYNSRNVSYEMSSPPVIDLTNEDDDEMPPLVSTSHSSSSSGHLIDLSSELNSNESAPQTLSSTTSANEDITSSRSRKRRRTIQDD